MTVTYAAAAIATFDAIRDTIQANKTERTEETSVSYNTNGGETGSTRTITYRTSLDRAPRYVDPITGDVYKVTKYEVAQYVEHEPDGTVTATEQAVLRGFRMQRGDNTKKRRNFEEYILMRPS